MKCISLIQRLCLTRSGHVLYNLSTRLCITLSCTFFSLRSRFVQEPGPVESRSGPKWVNPAVTVRVCPVRGAVTVPWTRARVELRTRGAGTRRKSPPPAPLSPSLSPLSASSSARLTLLCSRSALRPISCSPHFFFFFSLFFFKTQRRRGPVSDFFRGASRPDTMELRYGTERCVGSGKLRGEMTDCAWCLRRCSPGLERVFGCVLLLLLGPVASQWPGKKHPFPPLLCLTRLFSASFC